MIDISTPWGFKIHYFQLAIFIAALVYGPRGGMLSGLVGSIYSAIAVGNTYIVASNAILGFFVGLFARRGIHTIPAVVLPYFIQLPMRSYFMTSETFSSFRNIYLGHPMKSSRGTDKSGWPPQPSLRGCGCFTDIM